MGFYLWMRVKPLINQPRIEDATRELKTRSDASVAACKEAEDKAEFLEQQHATLLTDIEDLKAEVEATAGNAASFVENFALISAQKDELEKQLGDTQLRFEQEQEAKNEMANNKKLVEMDVAAVKADLDALGGDLFKLEGEKDNRDHQIRVYNDEIAHQEEIIAKYTKEKKHLQEINGKNADEFGGIEDRYSHLNKIKEKLGQTYEELNQAFAAEKKKRANCEKEKRKVEGDVKLTMETVSDLERNKKELESYIFKKDAEWSMHYSKYEDEQANSGKVAKYIKELQSKIEELEDEVKHENQARAKAELYKKRDAEVAKIKRDYEECNIQHEASVAAFRKKHNDAVAEMSDQIDHLTKLKQKID